jgi:hypothetical protein
MKPKSKDRILYKHLLVDDDYYLAIEKEGDRFILFLEHEDDYRRDVKEYETFAEAMLGLQKQAPAEMEHFQNGLVEIKEKINTPGGLLELLTWARSLK